MKRSRQLGQWIALSLLATPVFSAVTQAQSSDVASILKITPGISKVTFYVKASVRLEGTFEKWDATLVFTSTDASTGVLDIRIQADSVDTGSKSKDKKLKGDHCFDVEKHPYITFHSTKITETSPNSFDVAGTFTLRGVSKPEALTLTVDREAERATGEFVTIADRVDITIDFKLTRVAGPPLVFKGQQ